MPISAKDEKALSLNYMKTILKYLHSADIHDPRLFIISKLSNKRHFSLPLLMKRMIYHNENY